MTEKHMCSFYILLSVLFLLVQINCGRVPPRRNTYASKAYRRQEGYEGPPEGYPDGPPEGYEGDMPPGGARPPDEPADVHEGPEDPDGSPATDDPDDDHNTVQTIRVTDLPEEAVDHALILDYGRYSTINFHYEGAQWMYSREIDTCYEDYTKCYTSMSAPVPVCMMHSGFNVRTVFSYCDVFFYNCRIGHRYWRIAGYGTCVIGVFGYPYLVES